MPPITNTPRPDIHATSENSIDGDINIPWDMDPVGGLENLAKNVDNVQLLLTSEYDVNKNGDSRLYVSRNSFTYGINTNIPRCPGLYIISARNEQKNHHGTLGNDMNLSMHLFQDRHKLYCTT